MYLSTKYEIGDIVAIPYTVPTPGAGTTQGIIPGEIQNIRIYETVDHEGDIVTVIMYGVIVNSTNLAVEEFDEIHVLCEIIDYKAPYLEKMARDSGFVTKKLADEIKVAKEKAQDLAEQAEEEATYEREERQKARTAEAALSDDCPEELLTTPLEDCSCTTEERDIDCDLHGLGR